MTTTCAGTLSRLTAAMIDCHERTCEIEPQHRWENCTSTPGIYAVADALDVLDAARELSVALLPDVSRALHDRECQEGCYWPGTATNPEHHDAWKDQAAALLAAASAAREQPEPALPETRRGDLLAVCACGHIRRGHSVDGRRCYRTPCTCQVDGGFRLPAEAVSGVA